MSRSINRVTLLGHLGADPESRRTQDGRLVVTFRIATGEAWRDKTTGERKETTDWHTVVIFNEGLAKVAEQYLRRGSHVCVEGQLKTRKWQDQSGQDRYATEVVLQAFRGDLVLLDRSERQAPDETAYGAARTRPDRPDPTAAAAPPFDDEVPF
ncbi:single-stranded DNA-binding protein [Oharaeibacter diazotrophicus]|uniref:Single-stranded DNA-binding protein n=1 Tax=Oharaeibacter diazotrophicus TaxID=1920512 RepID=A0A4R6RGJ3_9HYPH|nr:single-stranded DNA-binding protein [Oharaeibacter diazotrophicus]TDP85364.1 single-strand binding protein [Oharaeibacter diazotrophicus]BBE74334.1 single-stranded DNA-binding protein [Pleomorphomonas sp. SM30]GLS75975.1 hypothetical protein GCM10007904_13100 [Oharaeibacter diazotrophicus]